MVVEVKTVLWTGGMLTLILIFFIMSCVSPSGRIPGTMGPMQVFWFIVTVITIGTWFITTVLTLLILPRRAMDKLLR